MPSAIISGNGRIYVCFAVVLLLISQADGLAIDNEVVGIPQVQCSEDAVTFAVRTRNAFTGNIYIKGKFNEPACRQEFFSNTFNGASYTVRIPLCGMRRIRQLQPQGMNYILVFVVNFHPQFNTKVDRAYNVRCFYAQQERTVTSQLEVSMLSTQTLEAATMLMPNCEYSIRSGSLNGPRVRYVRVGDRLVHRWECDNPNFGMLIKNCFVNDGYGSSVRVLDSRGCPVFTPVIQGPLQYDNSLNLAYVEVWAYKFPDRQDLYFQCQVQVCNKRENECVGITPPNCPLSPRPGQVGPSSIIEPGVTGPYGPVTYVRGTFERPFPGQELVAGPYGPYVPGGFGGQQQILPGPAPYGQSVVGQQVLPGYSQYIPGVQPTFGQQQVLGGPIGGGYGYGAASDEGANAAGNVGGGAESGGSRVTNVGEGTTPPQATLSPVPIPHANGAFAREFNSNIRNDDSDQRRSNDSQPDATSPNITILAQNQFHAAVTGNASQSSGLLRDARHHKRKSRHAESISDSKRHDIGSHAPRHQFYTSPGPVAGEDSSGPPTANEHGDVHLMDVTAEMVYVSDVGDSDTDDLKRYPFATISTNESKQICLNPLAFSLLFSCFAVLVIIIALLLVYLLSKSGRWSFGSRRSQGESGGVRDGRKWLSAGTLSTSSSGSLSKPHTTEGQAAESGAANTIPKAELPETTRWASFVDDEQGDTKGASLGGLWSAMPFRFSRSSRERLPVS